MSVRRHETVYKKTHNVSFEMIPSRRRANTGSAQMWRCVYLRFSHQPVTSILSNARGVNTFHPKCINWSYLSRGSVPRIQMNRKAKPITLRKNHAGGGNNGPRQPPRKNV